MSGYVGSCYTLGTQEYHFYVALMCMTPIFALYFTLLVHDARKQGLDATFFDVQLKLPQPRPAVEDAAARRGVTKNRPTPRVSLLGALDCAQLIKRRNSCSSSCKPSWTRRVQGKRS